MKAFATLFATLLLALGFSQASYAWPPVEVSFGTDRGQPFSLLLDGQPVARFATQPVRLNQLAPGRHWVEMALIGPRRGPRVSTAVWLQEGWATSFVLTERPGYGWRLRQVGTAALEGYGYDDQDPGYAQPPIAPQPGPGSYPPPAGGAYPPPSAAGPLPYPAPGGALIPMSPAEAAELVQALRAANFDDRRLPLVQQALAHCYLQSEQLAAIVRTMAFDESQKRVAVLGYSHLADPQNFHRVLSALTFSTSANAVLGELGLARY